MGLTNYQLVLLDNLIYLDTMLYARDVDCTVGDIIKRLLYESVQTSDGKIKYGLIEEDYTSKGTGEPKSMMSKEEWIAVLKAIEADPILCALEIHNVTDVVGNGFRAATFISEATQENVVIFKGTTTAEEWIDNGEGGYSLQTDNQKMALDYVNNLDIVNNNSFITSGHSKGGNLATYVTLFSTDTLIDKCLSFDGQGFSKELCDSEEYQRAMEKNGNNLYLVASNCDYVNVLFNAAA